MIIMNRMVFAPSRPGIEGLNNPVRDSTSDEPDRNRQDRKKFLKAAAPGSAEAGSRCGMPRSIGRRAHGRETGLVAADPVRRTPRERCRMLAIPDCVVCSSSV
jgi:hypothetical protein